MSKKLHDRLLKQYKQCVIGSNLQIELPNVIPTFPEHVKGDIHSQRMVS